MKNLLTYILILFIGMNLLTSCAPKKSIAFSKKIKSDYQLNNDDLAQLQFYLSGDIVLIKKNEGTLTKRFDKKGQLIISKMADNNRLMIDTKTPGICLGVKDGRMAMSFFTDDAHNILYFGNLDGNGRYRLLAKNWENGRGEVELDGQTYYVQSGGSASYLRIRMLKVNTYDTNVRVAEGKKVHNPQ